jgi:hypothetical protein
VGDIGVANEKITIAKPHGLREELVSGSKPEFGVGGFETYAQAPGTYRVEFMDQRFDLALRGRFTKVIFTRPEAPFVSTETTPVNEVKPAKPGLMTLFQAFLDYLAKFLKRR